jgi:aminomethyltransferase
MCNAHGGVIDDLYTYCLARTEYLLVINASRIEADVAWLKRQLAGFERRSEVHLENDSDRLGAVAVQGPRTADFINSCIRGPALRGLKVDHPAQLRKNELAAFSFADAEIFLARTGYTGEDGFEIIAPSAQLEAVWKKVQSAGEPFDLKPAGLGARDTLRTEMGYPLYGHELNENTTPLEAGLGFFVGLEKDDFVGREVLVRQKREGVQRKCAAFKMTGKSPPPRPGYPIWSLEATPTPVGEVVSGTQSPSLGIGIGMGYLPVELSRPDTAIEIEIRGRRFAAMTVAKPIYRPEQQAV